jgi:hypothetical protein
MTFLEFKQLVDKHLPLDANRKGVRVQDYKDQMLRQACMDIQEDVEFYRHGHETVYEQADVGIESFASKGQLPEGADLQEAWMIRKNIDGIVVDQWYVEYCDWSERHLLIQTPNRSEVGSSNLCVNPDYNVYTNFCRSTPYGILPVYRPYIAVSPQVDTFYLSPRLDGTEIPVTSITRSGTTATVTTPSPHGFIDDDLIEIANVVQTDYNGQKSIVADTTDPTKFSFTVSGSPATPATTLSTITARNVTNPLTLLLVWDGKKLDFDDADSVPFDERMALAVSYFIRSEIERMQGDLNAHATFVQSYRQMKSNLYLEKKDRQRISRMHDRTPRPRDFTRRVPVNQ